MNREQIEEFILSQLKQIYDVVRASSDEHIREFNTLSLYISFGKEPSEGVGMAGTMFRKDSEKLKGDAKYALDCFKQYRDERPESWSESEETDE